MITCSSVGSKKEKPPVFKSKAAYYNPVTRKWQAGNFLLHRNYLEFITENGDEETKNPFHLSLPLATVSSVEKRKSSFLFDAVLIRVSSEMHWFSSFPNRNAVYNNVELFWRDNLMVKSFSHKQNLNGQVSTENSCFGKELLSVLYDTEKQLVGAASALEEQSKQLYEVEETVNDMNGDLTMVEKQLNSLNFWPGLSTSSCAEEVPQTDKKTDFRKRKYNVTFSVDKASDHYNDWEKGILLISNDIVLLDDRDNIKFHFPCTELKSVKVVSPWELCIVKEDEEETSCYVMCPMLSRVLRVFAAIPSIKEKVVYSDDEEGDLTLNNSSSCSSSVSLASASSTPSSPNMCWNLPDLPLLCEQVEKVRGSGYLTDEEIEEISSKLVDLHGLATEVEKEKEAQMERINSLINNVEKTDTRINADTKKIRQLT